MLKPTILVLLLTAVLLPHAVAAGDEQPQPLENWQHVVRDSPYWVSRGVYDNLITIRRWVLAGESFCEDKQRHILFDRRATFLGYISNAEDARTTQANLNEQRQTLAEEGRADSWVAGALEYSGYPFALSCDQPDARLEIAMARYRGTDSSARLWGTWDGMRVGTDEEQVSLHEAIEHVYEDRRAKGRVSLPPDILSTLAGKVLIESGGQAAAHSAADARGIMQLSLAALNDCGLPEKFHFHRLAQVDCALRLLEQNHRNLEPVFNEKFGHLPEDKAGKLYSMLLLQAYHGGIGRITNLLIDPEISKAATYFAKHYKNYSAGDIALGMIFHNLGRNELSFASLYYVVDVAVATEEVCNTIENLAGCEA